MAVSVYSLSKTLYPLNRRIVEGNLSNCGGVTCDGLASRPGEVEILPAASCYRNWDKFRQLFASLGFKASLLLYIFNLKLLLVYCYLIYLAQAGDEWPTWISTWYPRAKEPVIFKMKENKDYCCCCCCQCNTNRGKPYREDQNKKL